MTFLNLELSSVLVGDIGWVLMHFLWQGSLLALLLQVILPLCQSARARHNWALGTLAAMCLAPVTTFLWLHNDGSVFASVSTNGTIIPAVVAPASVSVPWTGWLVGSWLAGVLLLSLRALGGLVLAQGLRRSGLALPDDLLQRCRSLQRRLAGLLPVRFLQSRYVTVPTVVGWLRPVILLPVAAIAGLTYQQLDALVLHELAHIRRLDAFTNIVLMMAETVLFYHPAIWWVCRRIRIEREHCCDDVAVAYCGGTAIYVEALTLLETGRSGPALALAANDGRLKHRVARLLNPVIDKSRFSLSAMAGLAFFSVVVGTVATAQVNSQTNKQDFTVRVVDDSADKDALQGSPGEDRVRMAQPGNGALWLKREGQIDGDPLAEAQVSVDHGKPVILFHLTPRAAEQFANLTRENVGHRLAVVVNGAVITAPLVRDPILGGEGQLTGDFTTEAEANALVVEMMGRQSAMPASQHVIRHIVVTGTQRATVLSYIAPLREGDSLDMARIDDARDRLRASGLFSSLTFTVDPTNTLTIRVVERAAPAAARGGSATDAVGGTGDIEPRHGTVWLSPRSGHLIKSIAVHAGDFVQQGTLLATLDDDSTRVHDQIRAPFSGTILRVEQNPENETAALMIELVPGKN